MTDLLKQNFTVFVFLAICVQDKKVQTFLLKKKQGTRAHVRNYPNPKSFGWFWRILKDWGWTAKMHGWLQRMPRVKVLGKTLCCINSAQYYSDINHTTWEGQHHDAEGLGGLRSWEPLMLHVKAKLGGFPRIEDQCIGLKLQEDLKDWGCDLGD